MRVVFLLSFVALVLLSSCWGRDLIVGSSYGARLAWQHKANYKAMPFSKRVKQVFYSNPAQQLIRGVIARDLDHSEGTAAITAGGPGFSYVNLRLKSARGGAINYQIEIYM